MRRRLTLAVSALALAGPACDGGADEDADTGTETDTDAIPACVEYELDGCSLLFPPTYGQVWTQALDESCAQFGTACHAQSDAAGAVDGLVIVDPEATHGLLLAGGGEALVIPGDPLCSPLFVRLASDDPGIRMPPGSGGLSDAALCSIAAWISDGASYEPP